MKYVYFISYSYQHGFGCIEVMTTEEISQWEHITDVGKTIGKKIESDTVVIMNYQLLRKEQ